MTTIIPHNSTKNITSLKSDLLMPKEKVLKAKMYDLAQL